MIIAIESASPDQSVALADDAGTVLEAGSWTADRGQGGELLPRLGDLLAHQETTWGDVHAVAVGIGPGSYTGLRVGLALAKGLSAGLGCPIIGVGSLVAWLEAVPDAAGALARAGSTEAYGLLRGDRVAQVIAFSALLAAARDRRLVAPRELADALGLTHASPPVDAARAIASLSAARLRRGEVDDVARLEPAYLRPPRGLPDNAPAPVTWL